MHGVEAFGMSASSVGPGLLGHRCGALEAPELLPREADDTMIGRKP